MEYGSFLYCPLFGGTQTGRTNLVLYIYEEQKSLYTWGRSRLRRKQSELGLAETLLLLDFVAF